MVDVVRQVEYYYTIVPDEVGQGAKVLNALKAKGVNLLAFCGFPAGNGQAQLDFVAQDKEAFLAAMEQAGIELVGPKLAFLVQDEDRAGAVADLLSRLEQARINITAVQAIASGEGRYGAIVWVKPGDVARAARVLGLS